MVTLLSTNLIKRKFSNIFTDCRDDGIATTYLINLQKSPNYRQLTIEVTLLEKALLSSNYSNNLSTVDLNSSQLTNELNF